MNKITSYISGVTYSIGGNLRKICSRDGLNEKILKIGIPVFIGSFCVLPQENLFSVLKNTYKQFCGKEGLTDSALMMSTCLLLKYVSCIKKNKDSDNSKLSNTDLVKNYLKKMPESFKMGMERFPASVLAKALTVVVAVAALHVFSVKNIRATEYSAVLRQTDMFEMAIETPFFEELFFREFIQGSLSSIMELTNLALTHISRDTIIPEKYTKNFCRIVSAMTFGLIHSRQSLAQAAAVGVSSYYGETWLYEKNGLPASFSHHCINNLVIFILMSSYKKK